MSDLELLQHAHAGRAFSLARLRFGLSVDGDTATVAIAGSDDLRDWWRNLSTDLVEWPRSGPGLVHLGFWEGAEVLFRFVWTRTRFKRVRLTGYSQGGAIAMLLALALHESGRDVVEVSTYGAPRVGDAEFCSSYPLPVTAYRCGHDPIPRLPRFGRRLTNSGRGRWVQYAHVATPQNLPSQLGWRRFLPWTWPQDHLLPAYLAAKGLRK